MKKLTQKKAAEYYEKAIDLLYEKGPLFYGVCSSLGEACLGAGMWTHHKLERELGATFEQPSEGYWWGAPSEDNYTPRVIALQLMAELARDGQLNLDN